jgi:hypothetical protein
VIPHLIHQLWRDSDIPPRFASYRESWARHHPGWAIRLWTDADLDALAAAHFPDFLEIYRAYPKPIMRADIGRYMVLSVHGGVYADLDAEALAPFEELAAADRPVLAEEPPSHSMVLGVKGRGFSRLVGNAVMVSPPGHPFWTHLLAVARRCRSARSPLDATGPFLLTAAIDALPAEGRPTVLPAYVFAAADQNGAPVERPPDAPDRRLAAHHWMGSWYERARPPSLSKRTKGWIRRQLVTRRYGDGGPDMALLNAVDRDLAARGRPAGRDVLIAVAARQVADCIGDLMQAILTLETEARLSIAFLVGDSTDDSAGAIRRFRASHAARFRRFTLIERDYGGRFIEPRWLVEYQRERRARIARARNDLVRESLADEDWVLWIDADVSAFSPKILDRLLATDARIVQPNCVLEPGGRSFDLNAWLTDEIPPDHLYYRYVYQGFYHPPIDRFRTFLSDLRYREEVELESVGGTMILIDANLHRAGLQFTEAPYRRLIETEGFAAFARDLGVRIVGLPNVEIIHPVR